MGTTEERESSILINKPDFKAAAKDLCEDPANMIYTILLRHKTAELEEWYEQIQRRNQRIRELESLLRRAALFTDHIDGAAVRREISEALDHAPTNLGQKATPWEQEDE